MELWASGFNAWYQLLSDESERSLDLEAEPQDLRHFRYLFTDEYIEIVGTTLSATIIQTTSGLRIFGFPDELTKLAPKRNREILNVAVAGNDKVSELTSEGITEHDSLQDFAAGKKSSFHPILGCSQITSNQTGFTVLSSNGTVYTWGDRRYEPCLGRDVTDETPASEPFLVEELMDLPDKVIKISSGGYATAALTAGNDVYLWGRQGHPELADPLTGSPTPLDLDGRSFLDVAVGMDHILVLTTERKMFVVGKGGNGQLGLGSAIKELKDWKEVMLPLRDGLHIKSVYAGYKNSLVIVE